MLKAKKMSRIACLAPKKYQEKIIQKLYHLEVLHITEHSKTDDIDIGKPMERSYTLSDTIVKARSIQSYFKGKDFQKLRQEGSIRGGSQKGKIGRHLAQSKEFDERKVVGDISQLHQEISQKNTVLREKEAEIKRQQGILHKMEVLANLKLSLSEIQQYESIGYNIGICQKAEELLAEARKATRKIYTAKAQTGMGGAAALFYDIQAKPKIQQLLEQYRFQSIDFNDVSEESKNNEAVKKLDLKKMQTRISMMKEEKDTLQGNMLYLYSQNAGFLEKSEEFLAAELEKAEAPLKFGSTDETFIVSGWLPEEKIEKTQAELQKITDGGIYIEVSKPSHHDNIPIELNNISPAKPFEMLMHLFSLPKFREVDPTFFLFLTFPIFFGFMLGDFGYGFTTLIIFLILKKTMPQFKQFFNILIFASIATIIFGFVFGEFFGAEEIMGYHIPHILSRGHQIMDLLTWAIVVGVIHVNIGLLVGFYNVWGHHGLAKAFLEKFSWIILEAAIAVGYLVNIWGGVVLGIIAVVMLWLGEGVKGLIEIPSIFSNILSYARLMAIGLASVKLAEVVNEFAGEMIHSGGIGILYAILLLVTGHMINIALGIIGPFLHSLRLHYVEFFTKFFEGGGTMYKPFGRKSG